MAIELSHHQTVGVENKLLHQLSIKRRVYQWQRSNCCTKHSLKTLHSEMCIPSADVFIVCSADPRKNELQICRIMARITHPASFQINYMVYTYLATNRFTFTPISYFLSSFFCGVRPSVRPDGVWGPSRPDDSWTERVRVPIPNQSSLEESYAFIFINSHLSSYFYDFILHLDTR